jgi:hypothetical protein
MDIFSTTVTYGVIVTQQFDRWTKALRGPVPGGIRELTADCLRAVQLLTALSSLFADYGSLGDGALDLADLADFVDRYNIFWKEIQEKNESLVHARSPGTIELRMKIVYKKSDVARLRSQLSALNDHLALMMNMAVL